jgi:hypothetical protein
MSHICANGSSRRYKPTGKHRHVETSLRVDCVPPRVIEFASLSRVRRLFVPFVVLPKAAFFYHVDKIVDVFNFH